MRNLRQAAGLSNRSNNMSFNFTNLISALTAANVSPASIVTAVQTLGTSSWSAAATAKLHQSASVSGDPAEVARLVMEM